MDFVAAMDSASVNVSIGQVGVRSASFQLFWGMEGVFEDGAAESRGEHVSSIWAVLLPELLHEQQCNSLHLGVSPASCPSALKAIN